jgi:predicted P-loop ATPase
LRLLYTKCWPDCDAQRDKDGSLLPEHGGADKRIRGQPGIAAMERIAEHLLELKCDVRVATIPAPGAKPSGWDIADAIAEGWKRDEVMTFLREHLRTPHKTKTPMAAVGTEASWRDLLARDEKGRIVATAGNAYLMLANLPEWRDVIAFDVFARRVVKRAPPPYPRGVIGDWTDIDDTRTAVWLASRGLTRVSAPQVAEGAAAAADDFPFDPVCEYLEALPPWDGTERLAHWLVDIFGAPDSDYARMVGTFWLLGMVRRAFDPGSKFDYMPILEGPQGRGKSTALEILVGEQWFGNTDFTMGDKDSMAVLQGKWLYEIAELDRFNRADTTRVKSFVSRQVDEYRSPYGRRVIKQPRRVVLCGSTNQFEYFKDQTGNRRFWPIQCRADIDFDRVAATRTQLWAEALVRYRERIRAFPSRDEQEKHFAPEQEQREIVDSWEESLHHYLSEPAADGSPRSVVSAGELLSKALHIEAGKVTKEMSVRIGVVMRRTGWAKVDRRRGVPRSSRVNSMAVSRRALGRAELPTGAAL